LDYFTRFIYLNMCKWACLAVTYILHFALSCRCLRSCNWNRAHASFSQRPWEKIRHSEHLSNFP